jgi:hypothetical protein
MKFMILLTILSLSAITNASTANSTLRPIAFEAFYVPQGFDDNDNVQVVAEGHFPDSCYRLGEVLYSVDKPTRTVHVQATAYKVEGLCAQITVPFSRVINLGRLDHVSYQVVDLVDKNTKEQFSVLPAKTDSIDDFFYAPVQQAIAESDGHKGTLTLTGVFNNSCLEFKEVRIEKQPKVVVVQPIAVLNQTMPCHDGQFPFKKEVPLANNIGGHFLLHVRTMSGNAINSLVDIE